MKLVKKIIILSVALILMNSCSHNNSSTTVYDYSPPTGIDGNACVDECKQTRTMCQNRCTVADPQCVSNAQQKARAEYQEYVAEQTAIREPISRTLVSFYDPDQCAHTGCGCQKEYEICYQLCGTRTEIHNNLATD